jgi:hypothetical protein
VPVLQGYNAFPGVVTPNAPPTTGTVNPVPNQPNLGVIDGTPIRVVILCGAAALGLTALKWAGFRFNVGVST